jgi:hypothetical protein
MSIIMSGASATPLKSRPTLTSTISSQPMR